MSDTKVQIGTIRSLGRLSQKEAVKMLLPLLADEDLWVRVETVRSQGRLGDR